MIERVLLVILTAVIGVGLLLVTASATYSTGLHDDAQLLVQSVAGVIVGLCFLLPWRIAP